VTSETGFIDVPGGRVWFRSVGDGEGIPLLCLHGGPGFPHDYLEELEGLGDRRRVVFYDQLGCGKSDRPDDMTLWEIDRFVEELAVVREALGLERLHLFGSSWGGMLALQYVLDRRPRLESLVLASSPASSRRWTADCTRLLEAFPATMRETIRRHEAHGFTGCLKYSAALLPYYKRHVCRLDPLPEYVHRTFAAIDRNPEVYFTMNGPSEFHVVGTLKHWDIIHRLGEIRVPTLVTSGRYDEATPLIAQTVHDGIAGSRWVIFEESSHMAHAEEPERYMHVLDGFLTDVESRAASSEVTA